MSQDRSSEPPSRNSSPEENTTTERSRPKRPHSAISSSSESKGSTDSLAQRLRLDTPPNDDDSIEEELHSVPASSDSSSLLSAWGGRADSFAETTEATFLIPTDMLSHTRVTNISPISSPPSPATPLPRGVLIDWERDTEATDVPLATTTRRPVSLANIPRHLRRPIEFAEPSRELER